MSLQQLHILFVWLRRLPYSRGFGIQSPWAYRFVRYVINEHYPYYAYQDLGAYTDNALPVQKKLLQLYFRLSNYAQAKCWGMMTGLQEPKEAFVQAGCHKTTVLAISMDDQQLKSNQQYDVFVADIRALSSPLIAQFISQAHSNSFLVIEGINQSRRAQKQWHSLLLDPRCGVSFDLFYCGIICFDLKLHKRNYLINF